MPAIADLRDQVMQLSEKDRATLALELLQSLEPELPEDPAEVEAAWEAEILRRSATAHERAPAREWREVMDEIRADLRRQDRE